MAPGRHSKWLFLHYKKERKYLRRPWLWPLQFSHVPGTVPYPSLQLVPSEGRRLAHPPLTHSRGCRKCIYLDAHRCAQHFPGGTSGKEPACQAEDMRCWFDPWRRIDPLEEGMVTHQGTQMHFTSDCKGDWKERKGHYCFCFTILGKITLLKNKALKGQRGEGSALHS